MSLDKMLNYFHFYESRYFLKNVRFAILIQMNRKKAKSINSIIEAFLSLSREKDYKEIKVNDIIFLSKVARSTFYENFLNKEDVVDAYAGSIFGHALGQYVDKDGKYDFSKIDKEECLRILSLLISHFGQEKESARHLLLGSSNEIFSSCLKKRIFDMFYSLVSNRIIYKEGVPMRMQAHMLSESFIILLKHWVMMNNIAEPKELVHYFELMYL